MKIFFEIIYVVNSDRKYKFVLARYLSGPVEFSLTENSTLGGFPIKPIVTQPRTLDKNDNPTFDIFAFDFKNNSDLNLLKVGQRVELIP